MPKFYKKDMYSIIFAMKNETHSTNYLLKSLDPTCDDLGNYLSWMRDTDQNNFIEGARKNFTFQELTNYINIKNESENALLFGIFTNKENIHIGNIKLEPIKFGEFAWLGILIGDLEFRGKGVGFEVIQHLLKFAKSEFCLSSIFLGVHENNKVAMSLYKKIGFKIVLEKFSKSNTVTMKYILE